VAEDNGSRVPRAAPGDTTPVKRLKDRLNAASDSSLRRVARTATGLSSSRSQLSASGMRDRARY
jgi:hypothetical protein